MLSCPGKYRGSKSSCIVKNYTGLSHFHPSWLKSLLSRLRPQCVHLTSSTSLTLALWSTNLISPGGCPDSHFFLRPGQQLLLWGRRVNINVLLSFNTGHSMTCSTLTHQLGRYIWVPLFCHKNATLTSALKTKGQQTFSHNKGSDNKYFRLVGYLCMVKAAINNVYINRRGCVSIKFYSQMQGSRDGVGWESGLVLLAKNCPPLILSKQAYSERELSHMTMLVLFIFLNSIHSSFHQQIHINYFYIRDVSHSESFLFLWASLLYLLWTKTDL